MFTLPYRKSPLHSVIIHIRLSGLKLFTFPLDCLIEVKFRGYLLQHNSGLQRREREQGNAGEAGGSSSPLRHRRHINLAEDKVGEEVVTAQSQIPSPQSRGTEYILSYIVSRTVTQAACSSLVYISRSRLSGINMVVFLYQKAINWRLENRISHSGKL